MVENVERNLTGDHVSNSMLYMWRAIISIAHINHKIEQAEKDYFETVFQALWRAKNLTQEQLDILRQDIITPQDTFDMLRHINDPSYRGQVITFAYRVARLDGAIDPDEKAVLDKMHAHVTEGLDMGQIRTHVAAIVKREMALHDVKISMNRPQYDEGLGIAAFIDDILLFFGIDLYS
jgi:hypothetical protein